MKKLSYSLICCTGLFISAFGLHKGSDFVGLTFAVIFGMACVLTTEEKK